ncbi:phage portal protein [Ruminococcaceae bacterium OttesenSCG-928-A16]|nr:phage portal protein [Ruminococcaceae bacterium OttesenSCG-928-A16]
MEKTGIFSFFREKVLKANLKGETDDATCDELWAAVQNIWVRDLAKNVAINLIANAVGKCEVKTYIGGNEVKKGEYFHWNYSPSLNQNSSAFWHKLIWKLCHENKALAIDINGQTVVADSFMRTNNAVIENEYSNVQVEGLTLNKTFSESEVLYFELNNKNMRLFFDGLYGAYAKLIDTSMQNFSWKNGQHWKVHVDGMAAGSDDFKETYKKIQQEYMRTFFDSQNAVLPEFDGYAYEDLNKDAGRTQQNSRDIRALVDDVFAFAAKCFNIPAVLLGGEVEGTSDAIDNFLTFCIDPICDQLQEEMVRKRYGAKEFEKGNYLRIDTTTIKHFDWFSNAVNVDKLISSGAKSINEVRIATGDTPINEGWADKHYMTKNYVEIGKLTNLGGGEND